MTNGTVRVWDQGLRRLQTEILVEPDVPVQTVAFHPSKDEVLATGTRNGLVKIWNLRTHEPLEALTGPNDRIRTLCLSPSANLIGVGWGSGFQVFSLSPQKELFSFQGFCATAQFSPDGKHLAAQMSNQHVFLFEVPSGIVEARLAGHYSSVNSLCFSPDGKTLATGGNDGTIKLWHVATGTEMMTLKARGEARVLFSPDAQRSSLVICGHIYWSEPRNPGRSQPEDH
jgi:WD40 repeat protein